MRIGCCCETAPHEIWKSIFLRGAVCHFNLTSVQGHSFLYFNADSSQTVQLTPIILTETQPAVITVHYYCHWWLNTHPLYHCHYLFSMFISGTACTTNDKALKLISGFFKGNFFFKHSNIPPVDNIQSATTDRNVHLLYATVTQSKLSNRWPWSSPPSSWPSTSELHACVHEWQRH